MGELLAPYIVEARRIAAWRLSSISPDPADVEDVASRVVEEMVRKLETTTHWGDVPFRVEVYMRAQSRAIDFWRSRMRRLKRSDLEANPAELAANEEVALVHAEVISEIIEDLGPRDKRILVERYVGGLTPEEIAARLGVSRQVVDTSYSRALSKLRVNPRVLDVRNRMREAV
jgi:RNA polymerase sigma factor (sigma-70 family)